MTGASRLAVSWLAFATCSCDSSPEPQDSTSGRFNVVLVVLDTLRADHLSCYGYPRKTSPHIDGLAAEGVRFERCFTAWPETCPAMAAMLSGTWCQTNGVVVDTPLAISQELDLLPEILQREGWRTAAFVMNGVMPKSNHYDQGFDHFVEAWNVAENPKRMRDCDLARKWIKENAEKPFFVWLHMIEPHAPYDGRDPERFVGDAWYDPSRKVDVRPAERRFDSLGGIPGFSRIEGRDELAYYVARYDSDVFDVDAKVGAVLKTLAELDLARKTVVIVVADHGEGFGEHDYYWHGFVPFDETAHVPLVIRGPGVAKGVAPGVVSTVDVMPTVLELLGLEIPSFCEGRSLVPQLRNPATELEPGRVVFTESGDDRQGRNWQRTARDRRFKLVHVPSAKEQQRLGVEEWMLFDLANDPGETTNVLAEHPEVGARLRIELFAWMRAESRYETAPSKLSPEAAEAIRKTGYAVESQEGPPQHDERAKRDERRR